MCCDNKFQTPGISMLDQAGIDLGYKLCDVVGKYREVVSLRDHRTNRGFSFLMFRKMSSAQKQVTICEEKCDKIKLKKKYDHSYTSNVKL